MEENLKEQFARMLALTSQRSQPDSATQRIPLKNDTIDPRTLRSFEDRVSASKIDKALLNRNFDSFEVSPQNEAIYRKMLEWSMSKNGICLGGEPGRGKTHLCLALAIRLMREMRDVYFTRPGIILTDLMALKINNHVDNINEYQQTLERLKSVEILFIDDLGTENLTEPKKEVIFEVMDERVKRKDSLRTFITTNLSWDHLTEKYHSRFTSRIEEICSIEKVQGIDFRSLSRQRRK